MALLLFTFALAILFWKLIKQHANCDRKLFSNIRYPAMAHVLEYRIKKITLKCTAEFYNNVMFILLFVVGRY